MKTTPVYRNGMKLAALSACIYSHFFHFFYYFRCHCFPQKTLRKIRIAYAFYYALIPSPDNFADKFFSRLVP